MTPKDRQRFEATLGQALPALDSQEFDELVTRLEADDPELATDLRNAVRIIGIPSALSVQQGKAKQQAKVMQILRGLFFRQTADGLVQAKFKIVRTTVIVGLVVTGVVVWAAMIKPASSGNFKLGAAPGGSPAVQSAEAASASTAKPSPDVPTKPVGFGVATATTAFPSPKTDPNRSAKKANGEASPPQTISYDVNNRTQAQTRSTNAPLQGSSAAGSYAGGAATSGVSGSRTNSRSGQISSGHASGKSTRVPTTTTKPRFVSSPQPAPSKGLATFQSAVPGASAKSMVLSSSAGPQAPSAPPSAGSSSVATPATQNASSSVGLSSVAPAPSATRNPSMQTQTSSAMGFQNVGTASINASTSPTPAVPSGIGISSAAATTTTPSRSVTTNSSISSTTAGPITVAPGLRLGGSSNALINGAPSSTAPGAAANINLPGGVNEGFPVSPTMAGQAPSGGSALPGSNALPSIETVAPLSIGMKIEAKTVIAVVAVEQGPAPIVAISERPPCKSEACPPIVWIGQAVLGPDRRIWASFTQATVDGKTYSVTGQALDRVELRPGLPAQISDEAPALVSDLLRGAIGAFGDVVGAQLGSRTTTTSPSGVSQSSSNVPSLTDFFLGRLSGLFSIPTDTKALVRVARVPVDSPLTILYGIPVSGVGR